MNVGRVGLWLLSQEGMAHRSASKLFEVTPETWCGKRAAGYIIRTHANARTLIPKCKQCFKRSRNRQELPHDDAP